MAKHSVSVLIKARDQASRKFKTIGGSALGMGKMLRRAAALAAVYLSGRAIKRFTEEALQLYGRQEAAIKSLSDALNLLGQGGQGVMRDMEEFASSIQKVTTYGDEALLELMAMGAAMGKLSGQSLKDATRATLGLAKAYSLDAVAAMRLVARAAQGDTASLTRYGIKLGEGLTAQEKFNKVLAIGAENFKLVEGEVNTFSGAVQQMKNAIGDVKEKIGEALMPMFKAAAIKIKEWAEKNQEIIGQWAKKTISYVTLIKDVFMSFIDFMKKDWRSGIAFVFDSFLELLKATFETAVILAIAGGKGIWKGVKEGLLGGKEDAITKRTHEIYERHGGKYDGDSREASNIYQWTGSYIEAEKEYLKKQGKSILGGALNAVSDTWKETFEKIKDEMPADLAASVAEALAKHLARLEKIMAPPETDDFVRAGAASGAVAEIINKTLSRVPGLQPRESRFLTFSPGSSRGDPAVKNEKNTREASRTLNKIAWELKRENNRKKFIEGQGAGRRQLSISNFK